MFYFSAKTKMENEVLKNFLKITCRPKVKLMENGNELYFLKFNGKSNFDDYEEKLDSKYNSAFNKILFSNNESETGKKKFRKRYKRHLEKKMTDFYYSGEYLTCKSIFIKSSNKKRMSFDELPDNIKSKISRYVNLNKECILRFLSELKKNKDIELQPKYKCKLSKRQLVVLSASLFNCDFIECESGKISRDQFITDFGKYLGIELKEPRKILNSITNAEELSQIFDMLKEGYLRSYSDY